MPEEDINIFQVRDNTRTRNVSNIGYIPATNVPIGERRVDVTDSPLSYMPYIGNGLNGFQAMLDYYNGNYMDAAIGASLLAAPYGISRITRKTKPLWAPIIRRGLDKTLDFAEGASPGVKAFLRKYVSGVEQDLSKIDIESIRKSVIDYQKRRDLERAPLISGIEEKLPDYRAAQTVSVRPATNRENFINRLKLTDSDAGYGFAGALNNGREIAVFPGYARPDILGHEFRHSVQSGFNGLSLPVKKTTNVGGVNVPSFDFVEITRRPLDETNKALNGVREILEKRNPNSSWHQKLTELDAELERARQLYYPNTSWKELYSRGDSRLDSGLDMLRKRFNLSDNDEANYLMQTFYENGYNGGGNIRIKPSHRGRLTELKARTGKTEAELYNDGNPAHKKMVVFARNSRKWHGDGGPIDYSGIKTTNNRPYNTDYISYIDAALQNGGMNDYQRAAVLANIIEESGGNPFAEGPGGFYGLLQWSGERYPKTKETDVYKEIDNQVKNILATAGNSTDKMSWTHGGKGSGYNSFKDAMNAYNSDKLEDVMRGYTLGYVRPAGGIDSYNNRLKVAQQIYDMDGFRRFDIGGFIQRYGKDKILSTIAKMKQSK